MMSEINFHQIAHELIQKEVEIVTIQGNFTGKLLEVGRDVLVIESRGRVRPRLLAIRIDTIVAIFRVEQISRGPFGFNPGDTENEQEESSNE